MTKLLKNDWSDETVAWLESDLQMAIVQEARKLAGVRGDFTVAADMNAERRSRIRGAKLKAQGMVAGEPDLRFYMAGGRLVMIELKREGGRLSDAQKERGQLLADLGFEVYVVYATCPARAIEQVWHLLRLGEWKRAP